MQEIYNIIKDQKVKEELKMATVLAGDNRGDKLLLCKNELIYASEGAEFLKEHINTFCESENTGIRYINEIPVFFENFSLVPELVICGAGTVGQAIIKIASMLDLHITVIDDRAEYLDAAAENGADRCICKAFEEAIEGIDYEGTVYYVVVTREHRFDKLCVREILKKSCNYIGIMGSRRRIRLLKDDLIQEGFDAETIEGIHAPIGLSINAETPEEIAVSIIAEIIQIKNTIRKSEGYRDEMLKAIIDAQEPCVMATIVDKCGSAPRSVGTKMLIRSDGTIEGSIGGGIIEADTIKEAMDMIAANKKPYLFQAETTKGESMKCGGSQQIFLEII